MAEAPFLDPRERLHVRRTADRGRAFVYLRGPDGTLGIHPFPPGDRVVIGRSANADIVLHWDAQVSGLHAVVECVGGEWVLLDNDSRNGTVLDGRRVLDRRRLDDGSVIEMGQVVLVFRDPGRVTAQTAPANPEHARLHMSDGERRVLAAMCEPTMLAGELRAPPTNADVARRARLGGETVRTYLRQLYEKFEIRAVGHARKRLRLVQVAVASGAVDLGVLAPEDR